MMPTRVSGIILCVVGVGVHGLAWSRVLEGDLAWGMWFYQASWWSYLGILAGVLAAIRPRPLEAWGRDFLVVLPWSVVWWVFFDIVGLRLQNWYYVMLPPSRGLRWCGFWTAFATVIPLTLLTHDALRHIGLFGKTKWPEFDLTGRLLRIIMVAGAVALLLSLAWPRCCFPLTWLFAPLLIEPCVARRSVSTILTELSQGRPATLLRLLTAGFVVGGLWELFNAYSLSRWIYTVPGLEEGKVFEMPILGFLGFPPFALATYSFWSAVRRLNADGHATARGVCARRLLWSFVVTIPVSIAGFALIDHGSVRSFVPLARDLPGWDDSIGIPAHRVAFELCPALSEGKVVPDRWCRLLDMARHRGLGLPRALELEGLGICRVAELARCNADTLMARWGEDPPSAMELRLWITAAKRMTSP
ncbi:hypothetical protein JXA88_03575 [Candidatus Fermentibacteria bacterium]|nr:hypothetical protein [Candidatus Fermentibacteria bacterium]